MTGKLQAVGLLALCLMQAPAAAATPVTWDDLAAPAAPMAEDVELAGFLLPVDYDGDKVYQFMLLPTSGACSHTPPPPPNQVVLVTPEEPIEITRTYEPVSVSGHIDASEEISQLFILDGVVWVESGYRISAAQVEPAEGLTVAPAPQRTPWKFLNRESPKLPPAR